MQRVKIENEKKIKEQIESYFDRNEEARFIRRLHGVLLLIENKENTCDKIAEMFGCSPRTVSNWASKVNKSSNIQDLRDGEKSGRRPRLNDEQLAELEDILLHSPKESGLDAEFWDGKSLSKFIKNNYDITLGIRRCQDLFKELFLRSKLNSVVVKEHKRTKPAKLRK